MLDELSKYKHTDHFFFSPSDNLEKVCNAPTDKSGGYVIYALKNGGIELIYIGHSGEIKADGSFYIRKTGLGGLKDQIVNGKQFGGERRKSWKRKMLQENIEALDIYWYVTHNENYTDCPEMLENKLLMNHMDFFGRLPRWNIEL